MLWVVLTSAYFLVALAFCIALGLAARRPTPSVQTPLEAPEGAADATTCGEPHPESTNPDRVETVCLIGVSQGEIHSLTEPQGQQS
jgi:hypothetical protein